MSTIDLITHMSHAARKKLINWFARQNYEIQIAIFEEQKNQYFKLKAQNIDTRIIALSSFIFAIKIFFDKEILLKKKNKSASLDELGKNVDYQIRRFKKVRKKDKEAKLLNLISVIQKLKMEQYSYRHICDYLKKFHRFEVSHTYLAKFIKEYKI